MADAGQIRLIAARLDDVAATMAGEASGLTEVVRCVQDHAREIAAMAVTLDDAAAAIEREVTRQLAALEAARTALDERGEVVGALSGSVGHIRSLCAEVRGIAQNSRLVSLNARIEAARCGEQGHGFAVVATAMSDLSGRTRDLTTAIEGHSHEIGHNVSAAGDVLTRSGALIDGEAAAMTGIATATIDQRRTAGDVARLTADTADRLDAAATAIGRVASSASIVGLLARQIVRVADAPAREAAGDDRARTVGANDG